MNEKRCIRSTKRGIACPKKLNLIAPAPGAVAGVNCKLRKIVSAAWCLLPEMLSQQGGQQVPHMRRCGSVQQGIPIVTLDAPTALAAFDAIV
jgi:hypothetical protein